MNYKEKRIWAIAGVSNEVKDEAKRLSKKAKKPLGKFLEQIILNPSHDVGENMLIDVSKLHIKIDNIITELQILSRSVNNPSIVQMKNDLPLINLMQSNSKPKSFWNFFKSS